MTSRVTGIRRRQRAKGVVYEVRFRDLQGRVRGKSFDREGDARRFQTEVTARVLTGTYIAPEAGRLLFCTIAEEWYAATAALKLRTRVNYRSVLDCWLLPRFGQVPVGWLRYRECQALVTEMLSIGRKPPTVRNVALVLRSVLDEAVRQDLIAVNPCARLTLPKLRKTEQHYLSMAEVSRLASVLTPPDDLLVLMAAGTGLRAGELAGLRVCRLDLLRRRVDVAETVVDVHGKLLFDTPKSEAGRRRVPLSPRLANLLNDRIVSAGLGPRDLVFGCGQQPLRHNTWYLSTFKRALEPAGLPATVRFHDLRHSFASLMIAAGVHPKRLSVWLGHTTVALTMDRYGHLYEDTDEVPDALDAMFGAGERERGAGTTRTLPASVRFRAR